jgi:hypothetical protein
MYKALISIPRIRKKERIFTNQCNNKNDEGRDKAARVNGL